MSGFGTKRTRRERAGTVAMGGIADMRQRDWNVESDPKPTSYASRYGAMDRTSLACSEVTGEGWAVFTWSTERGDSLPRMHRATHMP
jgi:hypothetical protein